MFKTCVLDHGCKKSVTTPCRREPLDAPYEELSCLYHSPANHVPFTCQSRRTCQITWKSGHFSLCSIVKSKFQIIIYYASKLTSRQLKNQWFYQALSVPPPQYYKTIYKKKLDQKIREISWRNRNRQSLLLSVVYHYFISINILSVMIIICLFTGSAGTSGQIVTDTTKTRHHIGWNLVTCTSNSWCIRAEYYKVEYMKLSPNASYDSHSILSLTHVWFFAKYRFWSSYDIIVKPTCIIV